MFLWNWSLAPGCDKFGMQILSYNPLFLSQNPRQLLNDKEMHTF
jgi:hypothetical protein